MNSDWLFAFIGITLLVAIGWVVRKIRKSPDPNTTIIETPQPQGYVEKCPHCGAVLGQHIQLSGMMTSVSAAGSSSMKVNGKEVCPNCRKQISRKA